MKKLIILHLFLLTSVFVFAQSKAEKMEELVNAYYQNGKFNGVVLVAEKGQPVFQSGYGFRDAEQASLHDIGSIFQIGSITKQFTAALIMQLEQEKKLSVKDKLSKYFKGFKNGDQITIEHLLTHTSGIYNYTNDSLVMQRDVTRHYSRDEMLELFKSYPPDFEPGAKFNYSNSGYILLGYIAEKAGKKSFEQLMHEKIFRPLGMNNTGFDFTHLEHPKKSNGYFVISTDTIIPAPVVDSTIAHAAGAIYSTAGDLLKWERAIFTSKILNEGAWNKVFTPFKSKYGYGWVIDSATGRELHAHSGGIHGFSSYIIRFPAEELVVVLLDNSSKQVSAIAKSLAAISLGEKYTIPEVRREIKITKEQLHHYVGEYQLAPQFFITITTEGNKLMAQATGQSAFEIYPEKTDVFFYKVVDAKIEFHKDNNGVVNGMTLHQNGMQLPGKKIK